MPLSGLMAVTPRPRGGVTGVELTPASLWTGVSSAASTAWAFREDRARYSEEQTGPSPLVPLVRHKLTMEFPSTEQVRRAVDDLVAHSREGVVAVVTMASGEVIVAGYSQRFGTEYPLRLTDITSTSGHTPADFPTIAVTLESTDAETSNSIQL